MDDGAGREQLFRVRGVSGREIALWPHTEAGPKKDASGVVRASGELLRQRRARKVTVTPSGEVSPAND